MGEDLDCADAFPQAVGKAMPMDAARRSREVPGSRDSGLLSPALPLMHCTTFDESLRKSLSNSTDTIRCICMEVPAFQRPELASPGKLALLDSSPLLSLQNVPFSLSLLASPSVKWGC